MHSLRTFNIRRFPLLVWVILIAACGTLYALIGVMSWKFSIVGDEWAFFEYAGMIADHRMFVNPFGLNGVYGTHRVLESYSQAIFLFLLGKSFFVWKLASVVMLFPSVIVFYLFVKELPGKECLAFLCVPLLAFSKYLCNFFKIGYTHSFCFFLFTLCLYAAARLVNRPDRLHAAMLGVALGLSFFAYIGPVFVLLLAPFFAKLLWQRRAQALPLILIVALVMGSIISIGFITTPQSQWFTALSKTSTQREFDSNMQILVNIGRNFLLFWKNFDYFYNHFVAGPYLDVITRWAAALGLFVALLSLKKYGVLVGGWIMLCLVLGLTNPYPYTPTTRGIFLVPYGVLFAAIGLEWMRTTFRRFHSAPLLALLIVIIVGINIYEAHIGVFQQTGYSRTALIFRELVRTAPYNSRLLLFSPHPNHFPPLNLSRLIKARHIQESRFMYTWDITRVCTQIYDRLVMLKPDVPAAFHEIQQTCAETAPPSLDAVMIIDGHYP